MNDERPSDVSDEPAASPAAGAPHANNQTISYLARRFKERGVRINPRHGQNFLIDMNLLRLLVDRAALQPNDVVLEVGTGTGALTALVAPQVAGVVTVEIDEQMHQLASEELFGQANAVLLRLDALKSKSQIAPQVIDAVRSMLTAEPGRTLKLVANLPYSIATPLVANLLLSSIVPRSMTITVQKEVADRMAAAPGSKDYGALSVWIGSQCRVELVRTLPPSVFWPRPKVNSAIVQIEVDDERRAAIGDLRFWHDFARALFVHRRKFLRGALASALSGRVDKPGVDAVLSAAGISPESRAEQLDIETLQRLCQEVRKVAGDAPLV